MLPQEKFRDAEWVGKFGRPEAAQDFLQENLMRPKATKWLRSKVWAAGGRPKVFHKKISGDRMPSNSYEGKFGRPKEAQDFFKRKFEVAEMKF